ncbi:hypothetical protein H0E87_014692 [Populus deltoides]|nr:hypothetical protein H0E87_014692 [Populus deltoides]
MTFPNGKDDLMSFEVYHPNIDLEGNVCLNILREDWKPVLNINTIIYGLYHLFTEPNYEDPLNHDAAAVLRDNPKMFESNVRRAMTGGLKCTCVGLEDHIFALCWKLRSISLAPLESLCNHQLRVPAHLIG